MQHIPESDWKLFRQIHPIACERFCANILAEVNSLLATSDHSAHDRFLDLYQLIRERDKRLAELFDDFRRSTATHQIALIASTGLLSQDEISQFSAETRRVIAAYSNVMT